MSRLEAHDRIVTPYTDPDRWTEEEKALFGEGRCSWDLGVQYFGQATAYCGEPSEPGASFGHCAEHNEHMLETCHPDGSPRDL